MMRVAVGSRRRRGGGSSVQCLLIMIACAMFAGIGLLILTLMSVDPSINIIDHLHIYNTTTTTTHDVDVKLDHNQAASLSDDDTHKHTLLVVDSQTHDTTTDDTETKPINNKGGCATVEEMGATCFRGPASTARFWDESSLRVREIIRHHFLMNGASRVRGLPPEQFCRHGFVIGKASEAGFGNEMYKILTAAALSVMLNRSLIIGQTRHIGANILLGITFLIPTFPLP